MAVVLKTYDEVEVGGAYLDPDAAVDYSNHAAPANVRAAIIYGPLDEYTGTLETGSPSSGGNSIIGSGIIVPVGET